MQRITIALIALAGVLIAPAIASAAPITKQRAIADARFLTRDAVVAESLFQRAPTPREAALLLPGATVNDEAVTSARGRLRKCVRVPRGFDCSTAWTGFDRNGQRVRSITATIEVRRYSATIFQARALG